MSDLTLNHLLLIDIDGLRPDIFFEALAAGKVPHLARLLGDAAMSRGLRLPIVSNASSITFASQASLFTGTHPGQHGIAGNQYFDRAQTPPRFYAFDVGDTLAFDDAVQVFTNELAASQLQTPTLYRTMKERGKTAVVAGNMYAQDADVWLKPSLVKLGRFMKGGNLFGLSAVDYDRHVLDSLIRHISVHGLPHITTMYFMGLDFTSHREGTPSQRRYLIEHIDPLVGELWTAVQDALPAGEQETVMTAVFSDHGQIDVIPDDKHSLRIGFPFDKEMTPFFHALGLDVHDYPGEAPHCDAVMALNGGMAHVYLHNKLDRWDAPPDFTRDVLPIGKAFWQAHRTGQYSTDLENAIAGVLIRNVEKDGWRAAYRALTPSGEMVSLHDWFAAQPAGLYVDPVDRLRWFAGPHTGDLLLISNYADGYYFGKEMTAVHGGLHPHDSLATLAFGWPGANETAWRQLAQTIRDAVQKRCQNEGNRHPSTVDLVTGITAVARHLWP